MSMFLVSIYSSYLGVAAVVVAAVSVAVALAFVRDWFKGKAPARVVFTEFVVDRSGSMSSMGGNQYDGANQFLADQQEAAGDTGASSYISLTTFDSKVDVHYDAVNMDSLQLPETNMPAMLAPRGNTRLYDTIYERLTVLRDNMRRARSQLARLHDDLPNKTPRGIFAVLTDGEDNMSQRSAADFRRLLAEVQAEFEDVTVLFLGANIDAISTGASLGVSANYAMNIGASGQSSAAAFTSMSSAASRAVRGGRHHGSFTASERHTSAPQQGGRGGRLFCLCLSKAWRQMRNNAVSFLSSPSARCGPSAESNGHAADFKLTYR